MGSVFFLQGSNPCQLQQATTWVGTREAQVERTTRLLVMHS